MRAAMLMLAPMAMAEGTAVVYEGNKGEFEWMCLALTNMVSCNFKGVEDGSSEKLLNHGMEYYFWAKYTTCADVSWILKPYEEGQSYMDSDQVMAAFLTWIAETYGETVPVRLNQVISEETYTEAFWYRATGSTLDELWALYAQAE